MDREVMEPKLFHSRSQWLKDLALRLKHPESATDLGIERADKDTATDEEVDRDVTVDSAPPVDQDSVQGIAGEAATDKVSWSVLLVFHIPADGCLAADRP